ncbi:MAG: D-2-hydroxyacid dehydrogenase [Firmicutes bacterium]|nr:D-2-hydroxyacid dehydrogenase [Bacillota bacterium]
MKIFYETTFLKAKYTNQMIERFSQVEFVREENQSLDCEAIIAMPGFLKKINLDRYHNLKWVQLLTAGYDRIDLDYFKRRNIVLTNAKDVFSIQIAEDVFSKILYFNRNLKTHIANMEDGIWKYIPARYEIAHSTVGIIGTGSIGMEIAKRMKAFDTQVIGYRKTPKQLPYFDQIYHNSVGLDQLYKESDYLIVAIPLNEHTHHMVNEQAFKLMKKNAVVINIARGEIIDQDALITALKNHSIRGAGLDVMTPEPLPSQHELWKMDNVLITPHNASSSPFVNQRLITAVMDSIYRYIHHLDFNNRVI